DSTRVGTDVTSVKAGPERRLIVPETKPGRDPFVQLLFQRRSLGPGYPGGAGEHGRRWSSRKSEPSVAGHFALGTGAGRTPRLHGRQPIAEKGSNVKRRLIVMTVLIGSLMLAVPTAAFAHDRDNNCRRVGHGGTVIDNHYPGHGGTVVDNHYPGHGGIVVRARQNHGGTTDCD